MTREVAMVAALRARGSVDRLRIAPRLPEGERVMSVNVVEIAGGTGAAMVRQLWV